jgi:hypothetical protein
MLGYSQGDRREVVDEVAGGAQRAESVRAGWDGPYARTGRRACWQVPLTEANAMASKVEDAVHAAVEEARAVCCIPRDRLG